MAKAPTRKAEMTHHPKAPASKTTPEPTAFERMKELTRRVIRVPKGDIASTPKE